MAAITAKDVAALRAKTGIGMMECKKALVEAEGDMEKALKVLRERGLAVAAKKEGRIAADGVVEILKEGDVSAMIEVNSETDFVAKNATFREFVTSLLKTIIAAKPADIDALLAAKYLDTDLSVNDKLKEMIFQIGEKINIRRFVVVNGITSTYVHGGGVAGVIVGFDTTAEVAATEKFAKMAKNVALQIASGNPPTYITREDSSKVLDIPAGIFTNEEKTIFTAVIADIGSANYGKTYFAQAYAVVGGNTYTSEKSAGSNPHDVAVAALDDESWQSAYYATQARKILSAYAGL